MSSLRPPQVLLFALLAGLIIFVAIWVNSPALRSVHPAALTAQEPGGAGQGRVEGIKQAAKAGAADLGSTLPTNFSEAERDRVDAEIQKVRAMMLEMDRNNSQVMKLMGRVAVKLQPLSEEQLDAMYTALTRAAATFEPGSAGEKAFREEALHVINEFQTDKLDDSTEKFTLIMAPKDQQPPSAMVLSADAVITEQPNGAVEITASETSHRTLADWNDPDSKSRRRYGHLLEGR